MNRVYFHINSKCCLCVCFHLPGSFSDRNPGKVNGGWAQDRFCRWIWFTYLYISLLYSGRVLEYSMVLFAVLPDYAFLSIASGHMWRSWKNHEITSECWYLLGYNDFQERQASGLIWAVIRPASAIWSGDKQSTSFVHQELRDMYLPVCVCVLCECVCVSCKNQVQTRAINNPWQEIKIDLVQPPHSLSKKV